MCLIHIHTTQVSNLNTNSLYFFELEARNSAGMYFRALGQTPIYVTPQSVPSALQVTDVTATTVSLSWLSPRDGVLPEAYVVSYTDMETGLTAEDPGVPHRYGFRAVQEHTVVGLANGKRYSFSVSTRSGTGEHHELPGSFFPCSGLVWHLQLRHRLVVTVSCSTSCSVPSCLMDLSTWLVYVCMYECTCIYVYICIYIYIL